MIYGFIDPPSPFASIEVLEDFVRRYESLEAQGGVIADALRDVRQWIAERKSEEARTIT